MNLKTIADYIVDAVLDGGLGPDYREAIVSNVLDELEPIKQAFAKQDHEICQILGKALGYPKFADDQKNFPGATGDDVCVGEHTAETIAAEAAKKIDKLQAFKDFVHKWLDEQGVPHDPYNVKECDCRVEGRLNWLNNRIHQTSPDRPLEVNIEGQELVIRIGINTLQHATEHCERLRDHQNEKHDYGPPYVEVVNATILADDVRGQLLEEQEDGTTPVHILLDDAIEAAFENGSLAFTDE